MFTAVSIAYSRFSQFHSSSLSSNSRVSAFWAPYHFLPKVSYYSNTNHRWWFLSFLEGQSPSLCLSGMRLNKTVRWQKKQNANAWICPLTTAALWDPLALTLPSSREKCWGPAPPVRPATWSTGGCRRRTTWRPPASPAWRTASGRRPAWAAWPSCTRHADADPASRCAGRSRACSDRPSWWPAWGWGCRRRPRQEGRWGTSSTAPAREQAEVMELEVGVGKDVKCT